VSEPETISVDAEVMQVEVAYARPERQVIIPVMLPAGATIEQAIEQSGVLGEFPEIDLSQNKVGIFGKLSKKTAELKAGDRVEIYRPLLADPKEVRRKREAEGKRMKKGGGDAEGTADSPADGSADTASEAKTDK
jgi:putative ubiquitin-RnfH superfamily antitoxin RatB of RatAB toxin-antitoxin module